MTGRDGGDQVVLGRAHSPLCRKGAVVLWGGVLVGEGDGAKKGGKVGGGFVIDFEKSERVRERFKKGNDRGKGGDVRGGGAVFKGGEVNVPVVNGHEYVLVTVHRFDGESARQVG